MNDLINPKELQNAFPSLMDGIRKAQKIFNEIKSFEDIERVFLKGAGLSPNTYRSYLTAVKQFYFFTKELNPLQVRPGDIEAFYDSIVKEVDKNTAYLRIRGLKKFFAGIRNIIPAYTSPFEIMEKTLTKKLNKTKQGNRTKKALTSEEIKAVLEYLKKKWETLRGYQDYSIIFMLLTSGVRASELCQFTWKNLEKLEGSWTVTFTGKGDKQAEQELYAPAVEVCKKVFQAQFNREPLPEDALFWTVPTYPGDTARPLSYHSLWFRVTEIGKKLREAGILKRELQFSPHLMRRSYATLLYKSGMGLKAIQQKTRHASIEVLVKHYVSDDEKASPYFNKVFGL